MAGPMTIRQLIDLLAELNLSPSREDVLDVLWLASRIPATAPGLPAVLGQPSRQSALPRSAPDQGRPEVSGHRPDDAAAPPSRPPGRGQAAGGAEHTLHLAGSAERRERSAAAIRVPAVAALGNQLELARALRPLKRRVPSRLLVEVDENATVSRVADERVWIPVLRPAATRWLELAVVVDGYESMAIWRQVIREFRAILEGLGAFSDIRFWVLDHNATESGRMSVRPWQLGSPPHRTGELVDPTGRRVIVVVSDCVGPMWRSGAAQRQLAIWGTTQPVAIVQPLAQRLWSYTSARPRPAELLALRPGSPNAQLVVSRPAQEAGPGRKRVPVPVLELEADWLASWSRLITASGAAVVPVMALFAGQADGTAEPRQAGIQSRAQADGDLVRRFRASASPEAFDLAVYLTAAPISLPVIRLVQRSILGTSSRSQVAEVFLGGLLRRLDGQVADDPDAVQYEFVSEAVQQGLSRGLRRTDAVEVLRQVSDFMEVRFGHARDFQALLAGRYVAGDYLIGPESRPFALVAERVLRGLGGQYLATADRLASALNPPASVLSVAASEPEAATVGAVRPSAAVPPARRSKECPLVCPYCYHAFADRQVVFRCTGQAGANRAACKPQRDLVLERETGQSATLMPPVFEAGKSTDEAICPWCHEPSRIQVCPRCHSRLPATFRSTDGRMIALAGPSMSGKTAYMTVLIHELRHGAGERLNAYATGADETTHERFVRDYESPLYRKSLLFRRTTTPGQSNIQPLVFRFTMTPHSGFRRRQKELLLSFADGAGEDLVNDIKVGLMIRYLAAADGVITLIDPLQLPYVRNALSPDVTLPPALPPDQISAFGRITQLLLAGSGATIISKPVAVVLTKMDALWSLLPRGGVLREPPRLAPVFDESASAAMERETSDLLIKWGAGQVVEMARKSYSRSHFFAVSSLGAPPTEGNRVAPQGIHPHRVTDPFTWLLNEFSFIPSAR
jgi:hypothetical protein